MVFRAASEDWGVTAALSIPKPDAADANRSSEKKSCHTTSLRETQGDECFQGKKGGNYLDAFLYCLEVALDCGSVVAIKTVNSVCPQPFSGAWPFEQHVVERYCVRAIQHIYPSTILAAKGPDSSATLPHLFQPQYSGRMMILW